MPTAMAIEIPTETAGLGRNWNTMHLPELDLGIVFAGYARHFDADYPSTYRPER